MGKKDILGVYYRRSSITDLIMEKLQKAREYFEKLAELAREKFEALKAKALVALKELNVKGEAALEKVKAVISDLKKAAEEEIAKEIKGDAEEFIKDLIDSTKAKVDEALANAK